jgi:phage I-like protein
VSPFIDTINQRGTALRGLVPRNCSTWNGAALRCKLAIPATVKSNCLMFMPGGVHRITPGADQGSAELVVKVDPSTAAVLNASLRALNERLAPHKVYFDKEHEQKEATAWPEEFFWSETPQPGVYAKVEFTDLGEAMIKGKNLRAFSPSFTTDAQLPKNIGPGRHFKVAAGKRGSPENPARVTGLVGPDCGTLTNNPAFRKILPLWASNSKPKREISVKTRPVLNAADIRAKAHREGDTFQLMAPPAQFVTPASGPYANKKNNVRPPTPQLAENLNEGLQLMIRAAANGRCPQPHGDFGHAGKGISFYAKEIFWAGDDLKTGGIWCRVEWTAQALRAICSGGARYISPTVLYDEATQTVYGVPLNLGGLVARTAFRRNQPLSRQSLLLATQSKFLRCVQRLKDQERRGVELAEALIEIKNTEPDLHAAYTAISKYPSTFGLDGAIA